VLGVLVLLQATLTLAVPSQTGADLYLPIRIAEASGALARQEVVVRYVRTEADAALALARGQVDLAATSLDAALRLGHVRGVPPRLLLGLTAVAPAALLVTARSVEGVTRLEDLSGKTIGIPSPGSPEHAMLLSLLAEARLSPRDVRTASLGERSLAAGLASGDLAAGIVGEPWVSRLLEEGRATVLADLRTRAGGERWLGRESVHAAVFVRGGAEPGHAPLTALCRELLRAMARIAAAPLEDLAAGLPPAVVGAPDDWRARLEGLRGVMLPDGVVSPARLDGSLRLARRRSPFPAALRLPWWTEDLLLTGPLEAARRAGP
jgi:ABC-type nitrate/sulfonate/bicarbonate transport system substrate-binding protein